MVPSHSLIHAYTPLALQGNQSLSTIVVLVPRHASPHEMHRPLVILTSLSCLFCTCNVFFFDGLLHHTTWWWWWCASSCFFFHAIRAVEKKLFGRLHAPSRRLRGLRRRHARTDADGKRMPA